MQFRLLLFTLIFFQSILFAQDIKINATVDKNPVGENEQFALEIEVSGSSQNLPDIDFPDFSNFRVISGPNVSSSYQIVNFKMSASKTYSFYLIPRKQGTFKIGSAVAEYKGRTIRGNSIDVKVVKGTAAQNQRRNNNSRNQQAANGTDLDDAVFVKVIPSKRTVYVNEEITLRYKIYFTVNIQGNEIVKTPEAAGCWIEEYPTPQRPRVYQEVVNGKQYNVAEIRKVAAFPSKAGQITIEPLEMLVETVVRRKRRRSQSLFDDFFNDPFGQTVTNRISTGKLKINVLPLPAKGKPANFAGLVGDFKIHSSMDKSAVKTNEAVSYKVKINGSGLLNALNSLPVEFSPDFEVYEPKVKQSLNKKGAQIASNKEFEYVLIPRVAGDQKIRESNIAYFSPAKKKYQLLKIPAYTLKIEQGKENAIGLGSGTVLSKEEVKLLGKDIRYIKENNPKFQNIGAMPYNSWQFYASFLLPLIAFAGAFAYRNHQDKMATNVKFARSKKAGKQAKNRLKEARHLLRKNQLAEFYAAVSSALLGYLADKTNQSAAGFMRDDVEKLFELKKVDTEFSKSYFSCLDEADFKRFAPGSGEENSAKEFYQTAEQVLTQLGKYF